MAGRRTGKKKKRKEPFFYLRRRFDFMLFFLVVFLIGFGLVMVYSASSYIGSTVHNNPAYFVIKQAQAAGIGLILLYVMSIINYETWKKFVWVIYIGTVTLLVMVLVLGVSSHGQSRWFRVAGVQFQPSEVAKLALIIFCAQFVTAKCTSLKTVKQYILFIAISMAPAVLVGVTNLTTGIICVAIFMVMFFVVSPNKKLFLYLVGVGAGFVAVFLLLFKNVAYRMERIDIWLNVETHEKGYQTRQAMYAIGSGGLWGRGLGQSMQKMGFVPESHNDMIFSIICEELGIFGALCVIALFVLLIWRILVIAYRAKDLYGSLIAVGVMTHVGFQFLINIAVVTNSMPPTGVTLPFISYGGTSIAMLLAEMGLLLSVSRQTEYSG